MRQYYMYILTNIHITLLYVGFSNDVSWRVVKHYEGRGNKDTFTGRYNIHYLLYFEEYAQPLQAIAREKELKGWSRKKKMELIKSVNPELRFLNAEVCGEWPPGAKLLKLNEQIPPSSE